MRFWRIKNVTVKGWNNSRKYLLCWENLRHFFKITIFTLLFFSGALSIEVERVQNGMSSFLKIAVL